MGTEKFSRQVIDIVAKRSANTCSNPDCSAITSGPAEDEARAINVGEAAHIYGARPGSARFNHVMSDEERSDITNAIWLCRNCHKIADADAAKFPAELLFEWRRAHESVTAESLGKTGALLRQRVFRKQLAEFENSSYLAQQIVIDKPYAWEYKLTAELLRSMLRPTKLRWEALEKNLYAFPNQIINNSEYLDWHSSQLDNLMGQVHALTGVFNGEIQAAWGPPGQPGSETQIHRVCSLITEACQRILQWEETVRFVRVSEIFREAQQLLIGIAGVYISKVFEVPLALSRIFAEERPTGVYEFNLVFELPPQWVHDCELAFKRAAKKI